MSGNQIAVNNNNDLNKIIAFALTLTVGLWAAIVFCQLSDGKTVSPDVKVKNPSEKNKAKLSAVGISEQKSNVAGFNRDWFFQNVQKKKTFDNSKKNSIQILSKPRPDYTEEARENGIVGRVRLKVAFNKDGTIGKITPVNELPDGLTEKAIEAARKIRFRPPTKNGKPYSVSRVVVYNFNIY
jgi:TonB family protein